MPRKIDLREHEECGPYQLSVEERDALSGVLPLDSIKLVEGAADKYLVKAGSTIGALEIGDLSVLIRPKIGIPQVLSLACYAVGAYKPRHGSEFDYKKDVSLPDALALAIAHAARQAFSRGLLHGYRRREEALQTVRGRIRFADQVRRRYGIAPPVEVRYQEFTDDVLENRLIKAAAHRLGSLRLRSQQARRGLGWIAGTLDNVSFQEFSSTAVPEVTFGRLNDHYSGVIALSRLILRHGAFESGRGDVRATGFLMDMNVVFQEFMTTALREEMRDAPGDLFSDSELKKKRPLSLDEESIIGLEPDLTWWRGRQCLWVGDAKYKNLTGRSVPGADLYQMLAYTTALNLPGGTLIYAKDEADHRNYTVKHAGKTLEVMPLDLSLQLDEVIAQVREIATRIRLSLQAPSAHPPPASPFPTPPHTAVHKAVNYSDYGSRAFGDT